MYDLLNAETKPKNWSFFVYCIQSKDEKCFVVDSVLNQRNNRFIAKMCEDVKGIFQRKHPAQVMAFGVICSDGNKIPFYLWFGLIWFGMVLCHINHCRLLIPNPFLYKEIVLFKTIQFSISTQFNCQKHFNFKQFSLVKQF